MRENKKEALKPVSEKQTPPFLCLLLISCTSRLPSFTPSSSFTRMHKAESRQHTNTTICRKEGGWKRNSASHVVCVCLSWHHDKHCWQIRVRPVSVLTSLKKKSLPDKQKQQREGAGSIAVWWRFGSFTHKISQFDRDTKPYWQICVFVFSWACTLRAFSCIYMCACDLCGCACSMTWSPHSPRGQLSTWLLISLSEPWSWINITGKRNDPTWK